MSDGFLGVLLGGLIAILSSIVPLFIKLNYDHWRRNYEKKEEIYLQALNIIGKYQSEIPRHIPDNFSIPYELTEQTNKMYAFMIFLNKKEIHENFMHLTADILSSKLNPDKENDKVIYKKIEDFADLLNSDLRKEKIFSFKTFKK